MSDWIEDFGKIVGTSKDVIENVEDFWGKVTGQQSSSPTKLPADATTEESKPAAAEGGAAIASGSPSWLIPVVVIVAVIFLLR